MTSGTHGGPRPWPEGVISGQAPIPGLFLTHSSSLTQVPFLIDLWDPHPPLALVPFDLLEDGDMVILTVSDRPLA